MTPSLRVAFVDQSGHRSSGAQESLALILKALPSAIEPTVVLFETGDFEQRLREAGYQVIVQPLSKAFAHSRRDRRVKGSVVASIEDTMRLAAVLRRLRPDLVHSNTVKAHVIGVSAARLCGVSSVVHLRDILEGSGRALLSAIGTYAAAGVICVSRAVARWYGIQGSAVCYNSLDLQGYKALEPKAIARRVLQLADDGAPIVGMVGQISPWKRHDRFLRILNQVFQTTNARGLIVGEERFGSDGLVTQLRNLAGALGIADRIDFRPWLSDPRVAYSAIDVLCNCSVHEPFGRTLAEAAACGVPSVCYDDSGVSELFVAAVSASIVSAGDEAAFAASLERLIANSGERNAMGAAARDAMQPYGLDRHIAELMQVYQRANPKFGAMASNVRSVQHGR